MRTFRKKARRIGAAAAAVGAMSASYAIPVSQAATDTAQALEQSVETENIEQHLDAFQAIATANGGTRAAGTDGYDISVLYVVDQLEEAGYTPEVVEFDYESFEVTAPAELSILTPFSGTLLEPNNISTFTYSGSGEAEAPLAGVELLTDSSGCEVEDFADFPAGAIAVIKRGGCAFFDKASNAEAAGAVGVFIFNDGASPDRVDAVNGTLGEPVGIPVVSASLGAGYFLALAAQAGGTGYISASTLVEQSTGTNVLAQTDAGDPDNVIVVGAHLDSVGEGPGIQDNGSGSATVLETAIQANQIPDLNNAIRFAFWGAEELGLIGSTEYVASLDESELDKIALNLNFDMVSSPNYVRFVYDGDGSDTAVAGPTGSGAIEYAFVNYFDGVGLASAPTEFSGRSDYGPFIETGIPAGGLFTGAEGIKTAEEAAIFGGTAGVAYDPCYHLACDTRDNVNSTALGEMSKAAAYVTGFFANDTVTVNGVLEDTADGASAAIEFDRVADLWVR